MNLKDALFYFDLDLNYDTHEEVDFADFCKEPSEGGQEQLDHLYEALVALDGVRDGLTNAINSVNVFNDEKYLKWLKEEMKPVKKIEESIMETVEQILDFDYLEHKAAINEALERDKQEAKAYRAMVRAKG